MLAPPGELAPPPWVNPGSTTVNFHLVSYCDNLLHKNISNNNKQLAGQEVSQRFRTDFSHRSSQPKDFRLKQYCLKKILFHLDFDEYSRLTYLTLGALRAAI